MLVNVLLLLCGSIASSSGGSFKSDDTSTGSTGANGEQEAGSLRFETPVLVGSNEFTKFWFPNTAAKLSSGKVLLSVSQGLDGYPCPPISPAPSSRINMVDLLPACAAELASNCSQMYVTEDNGSSWYTVGRNFSIGNGNHWIEPGAALDTMSAMAGCERGNPHAGPLTTFKCDRGSWVLQGGVLTTYTTVSATVSGLPPVLNIATNSNAPSFNGKALHFPDGYFGNGSHEMVTLISVTPADAAHSTKPLCCQSAKAGCPCESLYLVSSTDWGMSWEYRSRIDTPKGMSHLGNGIDESDLELLADGCILIASRTASPAPIWTAKTCDRGQTWQQQPAGGADGAWSVYPRLLRLENKAVVLSSGRPGLGFWVNWKGDGEAWEYTSIPKVHNELVSDIKLHFRPEFAGATHADTPSRASTSQHTFVCSVWFSFPMVDARRYQQRLWQQPSRPCQ